MISGWRTKTGVIIGAIGGALLAGAQVAPGPDLAKWLTFIGTVLASAGGGLGVYGVAKKVEKGEEKVRRTMLAS